MSFSKPPVVASSVALLAALSLVPTQGWARDGRDIGGVDVIYEMPPLSAAASSPEIIFEMAPLKPVKGLSAQAPKTTPKPAQQPAPALAVKPAPAPVQEAAPAQTPAPVQPPAPVAEAPKRSEAPQPVAEAPAPAVQTPVEPPAAAEPAPAETPAAAPAVATPPVMAENPGEAPAALPEGQAVGEQQPLGEQPAVAEAPPAIAEPARIGPPIMTVNPARRAVAALNAPAVALDQSALSLQGDAPAPSLAPKLISLAPEPAPAAAAPPVEEAPAEAQAPGAPLEPVAAQAGADARIAALLAEGLVGPVEVRLADRATMWLPAGRVFLPLETSRKLAGEAGLEWRAGVQGMVAPVGGKLEWLAPVELLDDGYIKTGEPDSLQPEKLLTMFQASLPEVNAQRARVDQPPVTLDGWLSPPALNAKHRLSGCVNISTQNAQNGLDRFFNCEAWALGREGAIKIGLADGGEGAARLKDEAAALADTIVFDRGKTYEEFDPAADKTAPYAAADLLTRDVTAKAAMPAPVAEEGAAPSSSLISSLFYPALFGAAALGVYVLMKRRREGQNEDAAETEAAAPRRIEKASTPRRAKDEPAPAAMEPGAAAAPSLFARLLPSLHARFARKDAPPAAAATQAPPAEPAPKPDAREKTESAMGGLMGKISALRSKTKQEAKPAAGAAPANDAEEPASALRKLAAKMRRTTEEPAAPPPNVSRVIRTPRVQGGAAPAAVERVVEPLVVEAEVVEPESGQREPDLVEPRAQMAAPEPAEPVIATLAEEEQEAFGRMPEKAAQGSRSVFDEDDFGLVEPGDAEAASYALDASRNRRAGDAR